MFTINLYDSYKNGHVTEVRKRHLIYSMKATGQTDTNIAF